MKKIFIIILGVLCFSLVGLSLGYAARYNPDWAYKGQLERFGEDYIVVSDSKYKLSPSVKLFAFSEKYVTQASFPVGSRVVLTLDESKSEVLVVWLIDKELP